MMQGPLSVFLKRYFFKVGIAIALLPPVAWISQADNLDNDNGFGCYKFGDPPQAHKNLNLEIDEGVTKLYSASQNAITINGIEFENIRLTFCKNKLFVISLETKRLTGMKFLSYLKESYGTPKITRKDFEWMGKKVYLVYEPSGEKDGIVSFYSREPCGASKK